MMEPNDACDYEHGIDRNALIFGLGNRLKIAYDSALYQNFRYVKPLKKLGGPVVLI